MEIQVQNMILKFENGLLVVMEVPPAPAEHYHDLDAEWES